jgi:hypothetical protein
LVLHGEGRSADQHQEQHHAQRPHVCRESMCGAPENRGVHQLRSLREQQRSIRKASQKRSSVNMMGRSVKI